MPPRSEALNAGVPAFNVVPAHAGPLRLSLYPHHVLVGHGGRTKDFILLIWLWISLLGWLSGAMAKSCPTHVVQEMSAECQQCQGKSFSHGPHRFSRGRRQGNGADCCRNMC